MTNQAYIPKIKGVEFTLARERAGFSKADLAKLASLTTSHVEQIENGESGSFYTLAIKFVAAKKIASILGLTEVECFIYPEGHESSLSKPLTENSSLGRAKSTHVTIAKENFDKLLLATQQLDNKKHAFYKRITFYLVAVILFGGIFFSVFARADIVGEMPAYGERLVITSETCKWDNGKEEPNWLFAYFETAFGVVSRACYIRYNNQIWLRKVTGVEMVFPAEYFKPPSASTGAPKN